MAEIAVNERFVKLVRVDQSISPAVSGTALDAGDFVSQGADGRWVVGGGSENRGIVVETVLTANAPISVLKKGILDVGDALQSRAAGSIVYGSPTGTLDDAATNNFRVGVVEEGRGDLMPDGTNRNVLRVDL